MQWVHVKINFKDVILSQLWFLVTKLFSISNFIASFGKVGATDCWCDASNDCLVKVIFEINEVLCFSADVLGNLINWETTWPRWWSSIEIRRVLKSLHSFEISALQNEIVLSLIEWIWLSETEFEYKNGETDDKKSRDNDRACKDSEEEALLWLNHLDVVLSSLLLDHWFLSFSIGDFIILTFFEFKWLLREEFMGSLSYGIKICLVWTGGLDRDVRRIWGVSCIIVLILLLQKLSDILINILVLIKIIVAILVELLVLQSLSLWTTLWCSPQGVGLQLQINVHF